PAQYAAVLDELKANNGTLSDATKERLAAEAFAHVASYDAAISAYFLKRTVSEGFPSFLDVRWERKQSLRYGENPHQKAAVYVNPLHRRASVRRRRRGAARQGAVVQQHPRPRQRVEPGARVRRAGGGVHQAQQPLRRRGRRDARRGVPEGVRGRPAQRLRRRAGVQPRGGRGD